MISTSIKAMLFVVIFFILYNFIFSSSCTSCRMCTGEKCSYKSSGNLYPIINEEEKEDTFNRDLELKINNEDDDDDNEDDDDEDESKNNDK